MKLEQEFGEYFTAVVSGDTPEVSCQAVTAVTAVTAAIIKYIYRSCTRRWRTSSRNSPETRYGFHPKKNYEILGVMRNSSWTNHKLMYGFQKHSSSSLVKLGHVHSSPPGTILLFFWKHRKLSSLSKFDLFLQTVFGIVQGWIFWNGPKLVPDDEYTPP